MSRCWSSHRSSAFAGAPLQVQLQQQGIKELVIIGMGACQWRANNSAPRQPICMDRRQCPRAAGADLVLSREEARAQPVLNINNR